MTIPTLTQLYEEVQYKRLSVVVAVAGHSLVPRPRNITYSFRVGETPTCSFLVDNPIPAFIIEGASVQIWVGFNGQTLLNFNGKCESPSPSETGCNVQCTGQSEKVSHTFNEEVFFTDGVTSAGGLADNLFATHGVASRFVDIGPWVPGTVINPIGVRFNSIADGVNKLAEPFGSPFMEMPTGLIRVIVADAIPAPTPFRTYFSMIKQADGTYVMPAAVTNPDARPRIRNINMEELSRQVYNKITVTGAEVPVLPPPPAGDHDTVVLKETASGPSPWIPPIAGVDQFIELFIQNELLDVAADVTACAVRYFILDNRLVQQVSMTVEGDPQIFLGATVRVINVDPFTGINANFFVHGYTTTISENDFTTQLDLLGGRSAGVTPRLTPFCMFTWTDAFAAVPPNQDVQSGNNTNKVQAGSKLKQVVPLGVGTADSGEGTGGQMVLVTFRDLSFDPDGQIVSRVWLDDQGHTGTGKTFTVAYDPGGPSSASMTLTVTDNDGNTASQTESVNIDTFGPTDGYLTGEDDSANGGDTVIPSMAFAASAHAYCSPDGGVTINGITFGCNAVAAQAYKDTGALMLMFGGTNGILRTIDNCLTVFGAPAPFGGEVIDVLAGSDGEFFAATISQIYRTGDYGETWTTYASFRGRILRLAGSAGSLMVAGNLQGQDLPFYTETAQAALYLEQGGQHFTPLAFNTSRLSTDSFFVNGSEMFIAGWYTSDFNSSSGWIDLGGSLGSTGNLLKGVAAADDPGTYYLLFALNFGYFDGTTVTVFGADIDSGPMYDMIGEGGSVLLIAGTGNVMKCIDASPSPVSGSLIARGIFVADGSAIAIAEPVKRLLSVNVQQMSPPGDLYEIT